MNFLSKRIDVYKRQARRTANESVTILGKERADTLTNECSEFRETFNKIHHIEDSFSVDFGGQLEWNEDCLLYTSRCV